ncbi:MAG: hypothetical protein CHACPFDD_00116 [Phycisphaerae bacterium]|nr:hypothetical protein [Phycisphaerae bacterium]
MTTWSWTIIAAVLGGPQEAAEGDLARHFGFGAMQIYKIDQGIGELCIADLDHDGSKDVALWNGYKSRIELLYQTREADPAAGAAETSGEPNEVRDRGGMRREHVPVAYRVATLRVDDLTGDGLNDFVFFGEPKEVVVIPGRKEGGFGPPVSVRAPDGNPRGSCLAIGDFDSDGRKDVALLGAEYLLIFPQKADGGLGKPQRIVHNIKQPLMLMSGDLDGDRRADLIVSSSDEVYGAEVWLQGDDGRMGAQQRVQVPVVRSMTMVPNTKGGVRGADTLLAVEHITGRLKEYAWQAPAGTSGEARWPAEAYSYPSPAKGKRRPIAVGDVTGDGRTDVVAADAENAQLVLFQQGARGLQPGVPYPGLAKVSDVQVGDADADGTLEVLCVSAEEKSIGIAHFTDGRLSFPAPMRIAGEPFAAAVGGLVAGGPTTHLAYVARDEKGFVLHVDPAAPQAAEPAGGGTTLDLGSLKDDPAGLVFADVNQDGRNDLLLFVQFQPLTTFLQQENGAFERLSGAAARDGLVKEASISGYCLTDVTGDGKPELLLAQKQFVRALIVKDGAWTVVDQYNPEAGDADVTGVAALPDAPGSPIIAMYDRKSQELLVLRRRPDHTYAVALSMPAGNFELTAMTAAMLHPDGAARLLMADANRLAVLTPKAGSATLVEQRSYETTVKDAWLADAAPADFNHDGVRDMAVMDVGKAHIDLVTLGGDCAWRRASRFQVFQGKRFSDAPGPGRREPREMQTGDVTGDGIDDLCVVVHDRLIVYPGQ